MNGLTALGDAALVLDDFHRLTGGPARDSVAWFIDRLPSTFQLVVATRSEPALPLAALRAHGELLEVRADDLGFTPAEADVLLNDRLELGLEPEYVQDLVERTEGWPAGIYLAALSLGGVDDRHAFVSRFGGGSRYVVDFLVDEVLEAHEPAMKALMLRSSVLERLCGSLCDVVVEQESSDELLAALSRTNLFLLPLDDRGEWYRFHHLFAQLLRVELEHREPGLAPNLHRRAFTWHRDHGLVDQAIEHALKAAAFAEAGDLIASRWMAHVDVGRHATVLAWLERFPRELLREDPRLLLVQAWVLSLCGEREAAADAITALDRLRPLDAGPLPDGFSSLDASLATLRGTPPWGNFGAGLESARQAAELEGPTSPWRTVSVPPSACACTYSGQFEEADRLAGAIERACTGAEHWPIAVDDTWLRLACRGRAGRVDEQARLAGEAVKLAQERGIEEVERRRLRRAGRIARSAGRLGEALSAFERAVVIVRRTRSSGRHCPRADPPGSPPSGHGSRRGRGRGDRRCEGDGRFVPGSGDTRRVACGSGTTATNATTKRHGALSERELVILRMLTGRLSERDIGRELYLSHNTIHSHTRSIYRKLGVSSRFEALETRARPWPHLAPVTCE